MPLAPDTLASRGRKPPEELTKCWAHHRGLTPPARLLLQILVVLAGILGLPSAAPAQTTRIPPIRIDSVRVGFRAGTEGRGGKVGCWLPVSIDLTNGLNPLGPRDAEVVIETTDNDEMQNTYTVPLPRLLDVKESITLNGYVRPGSGGSEVTVRVRDVADGRILATSRQTQSDFIARGPATYLFLIAGSRSGSFRRALLTQPGAAMKQAGAPDVEQQPAADDAALLADNPNDLRFVTYADSVAQLPTRWFGYNSVDLLVLNTGTEAFVRDLLEDQLNRKEALAEWVRRGGRVVLSVARNQQLVNELLEKTQLLGCRLTGIAQRRQLTSLAQWARGGAGEEIAPFVGARRRGQPGELPPVDLARVEIQPRSGVVALATQPATAADDPIKDPVERPVIVQGPCGIGRVMLVAVDLDQAPFVDWPGQTRFWQRVVRDFLPRMQNEPQRNNFNPGWGGDNQEIASQLRDRLESFDEVPVISFGWVALFILLYILVVGPLDYFFLKRVVKRLEFTWITFPTVVLVVSAIAYFSAYYLKGNELRINKLDVVDIVADLGPEGSRATASQVIGTTWFTLFSPRIQNYTIGVEPAQGTWAPPLQRGAPGDPRAVTLGWFGPPENIYGGSGRTGAPSLFRRSYYFAPDATGLLNVPIQVWTTKSFTASWRTTLTDETPLFSSELFHPQANPALLAGSITNHLPVELLDVALFYRGQYYGKLERIKPGESRRIEDLKLGAGGQPLTTWFSDAAFVPGVQPGRPGRQVALSRKTMTVPTGLIKPMLFPEAGQTTLRNAMVRHLDETWRITNQGDQRTPRYRDEVVLYGRPAALEAAAETVTEDGVSPSRLWLGRLPGSGERPAVAGVLAQETFVRVYLPVEPK